MDVGQFEFPEQVTKAIQRKTAKGQELDRQQFILEKTRKEAAIRVLDALRLARNRQEVHAAFSTGASPGWRSPYLVPDHR